MAIYPNLPLIEEKFLHIIQERFKAYKEEAAQPYLHPKFSVEVFSQRFGNTAGLFSQSGQLSGQAVTEYYITIIRERHLDIYGIFQENRPVYLVEQPGPWFFNDLNLKTLKPAEEAKLIY